MTNLIVYEKKFFIVPRITRNRKILWGRGYMFSEWDINPCITDHKRPTLKSYFCGDEEDYLFMSLSGEVVERSKLLYGD